MSGRTAGVDAGDGAETAVSGAPAQDILLALVCARRDEFAEAFAYAVRAREQLSPAQAHLAEMLDAFVGCQSRYREAQQSLHEASRRFAAASSEQQDQIAALEAVLPRLDLGGGRDLPSAPRPSALQPSPESVQPAAAGPAPVRLPPLTMTCFGRFAVWRGGEPLQLCRNRNGQAILRYLAAHPRHRETIDRLMEVLWPEDEPEVARHKLHVAISALRRALNGEYERQKGGGYLLCEDGAYGLNPGAGIRIDVDEFQLARRDGQRSGGEAAVAYYEAACRLYTGAFLPEDLYAEWTSVPREQLALGYLSMCNALAGHYLAAGRFADAERWAAAILAENRCDEGAHRLLLRTYAAQSRRSEVLRQYRRCEHALAEELGVAPMPETTAIFEAVLHGGTLPEGASAEEERRSA